MSPTSRWWVLVRSAALARQRAQATVPCGERRQVLAVDARPCAGPATSKARNPTLVAVFDHTDALALSQAEVTGEDELAAFTTVLETVPELREVVVTVDALHCQRGHTAYLRNRSAYYLFTVKGINRLCARRWPECPSTATALK